MLGFMRELRKVHNPWVWKCTFFFRCSVMMKVWAVSVFVDDHILVGMQVVTVGIVGGSDLSKITEQLGRTGTYFFFFNVTINSKCLE